MSDTHAARPTDLVALMTFDEEVRENQAVTRERLGREPETPRPLNAALEDWLGLGRHTWVTVRGRQVHGIATARELSAKTAWQVDVLIDAGADADASEVPEGDVLGDLLRQAARAAERSHVTHVLLRTPAESAAVESALRAGFVRALPERLWTGVLRGSGEVAAGAAAVRLATDADEMGLFQLYSRALPIEARQVLAMTFDEWKAVRERRWCAHGELLVATAADRVVGALQLTRDEPSPQLDLTLQPDADGERAGEALLAQAAAQLDDGTPVLALAPTIAGATEQILRRFGLAPADEFILLARRIARPVREAVPQRAGAAVPTRG